MPATVVVVSYGAASVAAGQMAAEIKSGGFFSVDVRDWLPRDPRVAIIHGEAYGVVMNVFKYCGTANA